MKFEVKITSTDPNFKPTHQFKNVKLPISKKMKEEAFDLLKIQTMQEVEKHADKEAITVEVDKVDEYLFHVKNGDFVQTVYCKLHY